MSPGAAAAACVAPACPAVGQGALESRQLRRTPRPRPSPPSTPPWVALTLRGVLSWTCVCACSNGTSMISLILPPKDQISRAAKMLADEFGTASNIKSRVNRLSVLSAITSTQQRLKLFTKVTHPNPKPKPNPNPKPSPKPKPNPNCNLGQSSRTA